MAMPNDPSDLEAGTTQVGGLSQEQAASLRDAGYLHNDTYERMFPTAAAKEPPTPVDDMGVPIDERRLLMQQMEQERQANIAQREVEAQQRKAAEAQAEIARKEEFARRAGVSQDEIDRNLAGDRATAAGMVKTNFEMPGSEGGGPAKVTAASGELPTDGVPRGTSQSGAAPQTPAEAAAAAVAGLGLERGLNLEAAAIREASKVGAAKAAEQAAQMDLAQKDSERRLRDQESKEADRTARLAEKAADLEKSVQEFGAMRVDPERYWANKGTGDRIVAGIGMLLGAIGAGQTNGVNMAVKTINDSIERDIDAQKANIKIKGDSVNAQNGIYSQMLSRFKDARAAEDATRIAYLDNAKMKVEAIGAKHSGAETKAKAQILIAQIEQKKDALRASFMSTMQNRMPVDGTTNPETLDKDKRERFVPGYGLALTKEDASTLKTATGETGAAKGGIQSLLQIANTPGAATNQALRVKAQTEASMLQGLLRTSVLGPGAVTEGERELLQSLIADPTKILSLNSNAKTALNTVLQRLDKNLAAKALGLGLRTASDKLADDLGAKPGAATVAKK